MERNMKLETLAETMKVLKEIDRDNDLQYKYVNMYWKKLRRYSKLYKTVDDEKYNLLCKYAEEIQETQNKIALLLNVMIDDCLNEMTNV